MKDEIITFLIFMGATILVSLGATYAVCWLANRRKDVR
jgi:hypothetical protein